jgi:hypothetical protein
MAENLNKGPGLQDFDAARKIALYLPAKGLGFADTLELRVLFSRD